MSLSNVTITFTVKAQRNSKGYNHRALIVTVAWDWGLQQADTWVESVWGRSGNRMGQVGFSQPSAISEWARGASEGSYSGVMALPTPLLWYDRQAGYGLS